MPEGAGITIPGIVVEQSVNNDPALQVSISRPVVPGKVPLTEALRFFTEGKERAFRADYQPSPEVGPELNITWQVAAAAGSFAAVRVETREFGGASGDVSHNVFYGNSASGQAFQSEGLIDPVHRDALAALIWTAASKLATPIEDTAPRGALGQLLLTDLTFTPTGDMVAHLNQGAVAAYSAGNLTVTIPKDRVNPLLSVEGRAVLDLFGGTTMCSSSKATIGHTLGAAGAIEAAICLLALQHGFAPGGVHTRQVDPAIPVNYLQANVAGPLTRVLSNPFGFGGTNCSLVFGAGRQ